MACVCVCVLENLPKRKSAIKKKSVIGGGKKGKRGKTVEIGPQEKKEEEGTEKKPGAKTAEAIKNADEVTMIASKLCPLRMGCLWHYYVSF